GSVPTTEGGGDSASTVTSNCASSWNGSSAGRRSTKLGLTASRSTATTYVVVRRGDSQAGGKARTGVRVAPSTWTPARGSKQLSSATAKLTTTQRPRSTSGGAPSRPADDHRDVSPSSSVAARSVANSSDVCSTVRTSKPSGDGSPRAASGN